MSSVLEYTGVTKRYKGQTALDGLTMSVPQGSIFGLIGANGAGKTTAMSIAAGLLSPDSGSVRVLGSDRFDTNHLIGKLTLLPQDSDLPPYTIVRNALIFYAQLQGLTRLDAKKSAEDVLGWTNMSDRATSSIRTLSHGMRRRVAVAQTFLGSPELIILDEPLSGLDPVEVANMRNFIASRRGSQTIIICSHNLMEIELICDEVAFLDQGRLLKQGSIDMIAGRNSRLRYTLSGTPPLDALRVALPEASDFLMEEDVLLVDYPTDLSAERVNSALIPILLDAGCGIRSIAPGTSLEEAFLEVRNKEPG